MKPRPMTDDRRPLIREATDRLDRIVALEQRGCTVREQDRVSARDALAKLTPAEQREARTAATGERWGEFLDL